MRLCVHVVAKTINLNISRCHVFGRLLFLIQLIISLFPAVAVGAVVVLALAP